MDPNFQCYFNNLYGFFCSQPDTFLITTGKGEIKTLALKRGTPLFNEIVLSFGRTYFGTDEERILTRIRTDEYGYFRFKNFQKEIRKVKIYDQFVSFINDLNKNKTPNVIIDLRDNNGGEALMCGEMASYFADSSFTVCTNSYHTLKRKPTYLAMMSEKLYFRSRFLITHKEDTLRKVNGRYNEQKEIKPNKDGFKGHIYILVGPFTQSASSMFCSFLMNQQNVTFVGSETNGAINFFWAGHFFDARLPNLQTNFDFGVELLEFKKSSVKTEAQLPLVPDVKIIYTIDDVMKHRDLEMEWVKNDIRKNK